MREVAQPVAVVTSFMPPTVSNDANHDESSTRTFHGATLSSFTCISMEPYPLIAFALRIPSRMATSLKSAEAHHPSHMVINLLSSSQTSTAVEFSRADLYPEPFSTVPYMLSEEGLPILEGSLGALSCKLVSTALPLHDLEFLGRHGVGGELGMVAPLDKNMVSSELFIGRVIRVEKLTEDDESRKFPLIYHRRAFTTISS